MVGAGSEGDEVICRVFVCGVNVTDLASVGAAGAKPPVTPEGNLLRENLPGRHDCSHRAVLEDGTVL